MPEPTAEAWAQIRHAYEHTDKPLAHICDEHEITIPMMRYRMKRWNWTRRKPLIPRDGPPPVPPSVDTFRHSPLEGEGLPAEPQRQPAGWGEAEEVAERQAPEPIAHYCPAPPSPGEDEAAPACVPPPASAWGRQENIAPRLRSAVAGVLTAIEATIARLAAGPGRPRELEQAGRSLSALTRTLRELNALQGQHEKAEDEANEMSRDIDAFRDELARRIKGIVAARRQAAEEAKANEANAEEAKEEET